MIGKIGKCPQCKHSFKIASTETVNPSPEPLLSTNQAIYGISAASDPLDTPTQSKPELHSDEESFQMSANGRNVRKERYNSDRLRALVEKVNGQSSRLTTLCKGMDDDEVKDIIVDGHAMMIRGLNQIDNFIDNASRAVREAKMSNDSI